MTTQNDFISGIGNTPLIKLRAASEITGCNIYGKAEFLNPGGSVKDRAALALIKDAESKKLISKLDALKETMVITSGDNYVGAAEPQLREKMTNLFQRVESNPGAPTPNELSLIHI